MWILSCSLARTSSIAVAFTTTTRARGRIRRQFTATTIYLSQSYDYVIGYGSIMCPTSRAVTSPELLEALAIPVAVRGVQRGWCKHSARSYTAMGIHLDATSSCTGVVMPVTAQQLALLDRREAGYHRVKIPWNDLQRVDFLTDDYYNNKAVDHSSSSSSCTLRIMEHLLSNHNNNKNNNNKNDNKVWIYQPNQPKFPTHEKPIAQSYLDTILRGCLDINTDFAIHFLTNTRGWSALEECTTTRTIGDHHDNNPQRQLQLQQPVVHWVDDRAEPRYLRADREWILQNIHLIDQLLLQHKPNEFQHRRGDDNDSMERRVTTE